jgi:KDO2-lipid IV(A) lauroyltransferase
MRGPVEDAGERRTGPRHVRAGKTNDVQGALMFKLVLDYAVYLVSRAVECAVLLTPLSVGMRIGRGVGLLVWWMDRRHRRIAVDNIRQVYGAQMTPAAARRLARHSFTHMGSVTAEVLYFRRLVREDTIDRYAAVQGYGVLRDLVLAGQGTIVVTAHLGNWELASHLCSILGFPPFSVARPPSNRFIARRLRQVRLASGQELIDKRGAMGAMEDVVASGGILGFLGDQHAGRTGVWVNFLGRPASTHKAIALLALTLKAPILVMYTYRVGKGFFYVIRIEEKIDPADYADDPQAIDHITQRYTDVLGRAILAHPGQWLWAHRRWRERPRRK